MAKLTKYEAELETARLKYEFRNKIVTGASISFWIASLGIPMYFVWKCVEALAGKTTLLAAISVNVIIHSIGYGSLGLTTVILLVKLFKQSKELKRVRVRLGKLEVDYESIKE